MKPVWPFIIGAIWAQVGDPVIMDQLRIVLGESEAESFVNYVKRLGDSFTGTTQL